MKTWKAENRGHDSIHMLGWINFFPLRLRDNKCAATIVECKLGSEQTHRRGSAKACLYPHCLVFIFGLRSKWRWLLYTRSRIFSQCQTQIRRVCLRSSPTKNLSSCFARIFSLRDSMANVFVCMLWIKEASTRSEQAKKWNHDLLKNRKTGKNRTRKSEK